MRWSLNLRGADGWRFRHELLREVAAELAPPTVRRGLHAKVADVLIGAGEPDWQLIAAHYEQADRYDDAAAAYRHSCGNARLRGALAEAVAYLSRGLALLEQATPGPNRDHRETALRLERGFLTSAAEGYQSSEAATDFERCLRLSGNLTDDELFATLVALGNYYLVRADLRRAAQVIESLRKGSGKQQWAGSKRSTFVRSAGVSWRRFRCRDRGTRCRRGRCGRPRSADRRRRSGLALPRRSRAGARRPRRS